MADLPRPTRPLPVADVEGLTRRADAFACRERLELAHATAAAVVSAGRDASPPRAVDLVDLAEQVGLETLAELWRDAAVDTLPGALWTLYVLRTWCVYQGEEVARLFASGRALAPVDEVVAGAADDADPTAMITLADSVLGGVYGGELDVALERAAAFFRVVAEGRSALAPDDHDGDAERARAVRNRVCAEGLARAAHAWRAGTLR